MNLVHQASPKEIGQALCLSERTVQRYLSSFQQTGDVQPVARQNGPQRLLGDFEQLLLLRLIITNPGIYLRELQDKLQEGLGSTVSVSTICRTLKFMGCTKQVIRHVAVQQDDAMRVKFMAEISMFDPSMFIWVDESGCDQRNSRRKYGYSVRGIRPVDHRLLIRGTRYSAIPIMSANGIHDVYLTEETVNGYQFSHFLTEFLIPLLLPFNGINPRSIVIMDNASIHHVDTNVQLIENTQAKLIFLPPYSPDLNPLEMVFSKVKAIMKENDTLFQASTAPRALLMLAFGMVTTDDCIAFSRHCGYLH